MIELTLAFRLELLSPPIFSKAPGSRWRLPEPAIDKLPTARRCYWVVEATGVDWWGYIEGNPAVLAGLCLVTVLFAVAYLVQRYRSSSIRAEHEQRKAG